ncbi:MAG: MBL fold metallo-hydrolase [Anaerolineales bacterium]
MSLQKVVPGFYWINLGFVNAYLFETQDGLILIDTGVSNSTDKILSAVESLGKQPSDIKHILVTHLHGDHTGSLAALKKATGAPASMHSLDAQMVRVGQAGRPFQPGPGLLSRFIIFLMSRRGPTLVEAAEIENELSDGQILDSIAGIKVIHAPGHAAGQVAFLIPMHGGILIAADSCNNRSGLGYPPIFEDMEIGVQTLKKLSALDFEVAVFGHGKPITSGASKAFKQKWG